MSGSGSIDGEAAPAELAQTRLALARALWEGGTDPARGVELAAQAREQQPEAIDARLAAHPASGEPAPAPAPARPR